MTEPTREQILASITPKSDQWNFDDLVDGPRTFTIAGVSGGTAEQPINIRLDGERRFYRPGKSMRRVLVMAWGSDGHAWVGRSVTLYGDPAVKFGGVMVGGIRISHMSDIDGAQTFNLTASRGKKSPFKVLPLTEQPRSPDVMGRTNKGTAEPQSADQGSEDGSAVAEPPSLDADADLINGVTVEAKKGMDIFKIAWESLTPDERKTIGETGKNALKRIAANADLPDGLREKLDAGGNPLPTTAAG